MRKTKQESQDGFSIIEMLIAIVVVTFGLASVAGISVYVSRANTISNGLNVLAAAAQDQADRLRMAQWTETVENPMVTVGGSMSPGRLYVSASSQPSTYILDPDNPHHAVTANTPLGDLDICWQVRQGATPDLRYVTIKVVEVIPQPNLQDGFTITTMIARN